MPDSKSSETIQTIEELQARFQSFAEQKIKVETQRDHARQELEKLKAEALEQFGSDDLATLKSQLQEMRQSNEQKRIDYQKQLDSIEQKLSEIDEQFLESELDEV